MTFICRENALERFYHEWRLTVSVSAEELTCILTFRLWCVWNSHWEWVTWVFFFVMWNTSKHSLICLLLFKIGIYINCLFVIHRNCLFVIQINCLFVIQINCFSFYPCFLFFFFLRMFSLSLSLSLLFKLLYMNLLMSTLCHVFPPFLSVLYRSCVCVFLLFCILLP